MKLAQAGDLAKHHYTERAVRAALAIQRALAELNRENAGAGMPALAARIAMHEANLARFSRLGDVEHGHAGRPVALRGDFGKGQIRNAETLSRCTP